MPTYYDESIDPHDPDDDAFNDKLTPSHTVQSVQHKLNVVKPEDQSIPKPKSAYILVSIFCLLTAFGGFVFGWDTGTISGFLNMTDFQQRFGEPKKDGTGYQFPKIRTGLVVGIFNVGCAIGGVFLSKLGDMWGRRKGIMSIMVLYIGGIAIQISSNELWIQYMIGRIISGLAVGGIAVIVPMFISETSPKQIRGTLVSCYQLMITIGIFAGYCTTYGTKSRNDSTQWRIPLGLCFLWAIFLITGMILMPESPRFLVQKGMLEKARQSLARINRVSPEDTSVYAEIEEIDSAIDFERSQGKATWGELITGKPKIFKRVFIGVVVQSLQQLTGANYFFYYGTTIFNAIGMDDSFVTSMILGAVNFITTFGGLYIVDRYGRRKALMGGSMLMFSCMCVFAAVGVTKLYPDGYDGETSKAAGNVMILFTCLFITGFATTWHQLHGLLWQKLIQFV